MMNILILSGKFGMGHNSAAQALKKEFEKIDSENKVDIVDLLEYLHPELKDFIYSGFNKMVNKYYKLYNVLYKISEKLEVDMKLSGNKINRKISQLIASYEPDLIVATLPLCARTISAYKEFNELDIPLVTCITDVSMHIEWISKKSDYYLVPSEGVRETLMKRGVNGDKISIVGIPVKESFYEEKEDKRDKNRILVMGGGLGLIPEIDEILSTLSLYKDKKVTVIAGNNKELYNKVRDEYPDIEILGFTDRVDEYMAQSDFIISKAGGITLFESIYSKLPIFVIKPFLAQEISNAKFIEEKNIGKVIWSGNIKTPLRLFVEDEINKEIMRENMKKIKSESTREEISSVLGNISQGLR